MRPIRLPIVLCILTFLTYAGSDWPMYLGDLSHTSFRPGEKQIDSSNVSQLQQLWKTSVGGRIASGVTVVDGFLFFGDWNGNFHSLNAMTGEISWSRFLGKAPTIDPTCSPGVGISAQPTVAGETVYAAGGDSAVYAMDRRTGEILWRVPLADPNTGSYLWSSLAIYRNSIYMGLASLTDCPLVRGGLARISLDDPAHPQIVYLVPPNELGASIWSTPAIDERNNLVYVTTGNAEVQDAERGVWASALLALDATTLEIRSYFLMPLTPEENDPDWGSSPLLFESGGQSLVAANGKNGVMYVLRRPDLALLWSYKLAIDCDSPTVGCGSISTPAFDGNILVTGAGQPEGEGSPPGTVYAFDPATRKLLWLYPARAAVLAPVTLTPGLVFVSTTKGLALLHAATGAELWTDGGRGGLFSQPVVSNGILYSTYINGDTIAWGIPSSGGTLALTVSKSGLKFLYTGGGPPAESQTINVSASTPSVSFTVASDSSWLTADFPSAVTPAVMTVRANALSMPPGTYTGNLNLTAVGSNAVSIRVTLVVNGVLSSLGATNIVNAASFQPGLAPGSLFTIFAGSLSAGQTTATTTPWPAEWNGISVKINGVAAPLAYVSPTQINAQVPYEIAPGTAQLIVASNGAETGPVTLTIQETAPAIFMDSGSRAAALNQDGLVNLPENPVPPGTILSVFITGQGLVDLAVESGAAAPFDVLSNTLAETNATIGGRPAAVSFSGLAPGFVGLGQVNLRIPDLPSGIHSIVLTIGNAASNHATIAVRK